MKRGRRARGRLAAAALCLLSGLGAALPAAGAVFDPEQAPRPSQLLGVWWVSGDGVKPGTALRLDGIYLDVEDGSCTGRGTWEARPSGLFVASLYPYKGCPAPPAWLFEAVAFRPDGPRRELLDRGGQVVVTLRRAKAEPYGAFARQPVDELSPGHRRRFDRPPAPAPLGVLPAALRELVVGRWMPAAGAEKSPDLTYVDLQSDGRWRGRELCSGMAGRWVIGADGGFVATDEGRDLPSCRAVPPVTRWISDAAWAGFVGTELVLVDLDGDELGRLTRDTRVQT